MTSRHKTIYHQKATDTRVKHARMLGMKSSLLRTYYKWDTDSMAIDIMKCKKCPFCQKLYRELRDITLDIKNPTNEPFYRENTQWICGICNSKKRCSNQDQYKHQLTNFNNQTLVPYIAASFSLQPLSPEQKENQNLKTINEVLHDENLQLYESNKEINEKYSSLKESAGIYVRHIKAGLEPLGFIVDVDGNIKPKDTP